MRIVLQQIRNQIESSCNFNLNQSAYRQKHSSETALLKSLSDIYKNIDNSSATLMVALDLSAAFDMVPHQILLRRLERSYGFSGLALEWLASYLSNRSQYVHINGQKSPKHSLTCGVPQGSVLGPILFTAYISPIGFLPAKTK